MRHEAGLQVPEPILTKEGSLVVREATEGVPGERSCCLFRWMEGRFIRDQSWNEPETWARFGEFLGRMHRFSQEYQPPAGFVRQRWDGVESYYQIRFEDAFRTLEPLIPPEDLDLLRGAVEKGRNATCAIGERPDVWGLIHADLHGGNCIVRDGELCAFDFDDSGFGPYLYDVALVLRGTHGKSHCRSALLESYRRHKPLPEDLEAYLEPLERLRRMNLLIWCFGNLSNNTRIHNSQAEEAREMAEHLRKPP
jgi:Ser/Thr protein kinase RdoA (MazF antagonist)